MLAVCCYPRSACARSLAFKWTVEVSQPLPYAAEALQGESFNLEAKVVQYRVPMLEAAEAPSTPAAGLSPARHFFNREMEVKSEKDKALKTLARSLPLPERKKFF